MMRNPPLEIIFKYFPKNISENKPQEDITTYLESIVLAYENNDITEIQRDYLIEELTLILKNEDYNLFPKNIKKNIIRFRLNLGIGTEEISRKKEKRGLENSLNYSNNMIYLN